MKKRLLSIFMTTCILTTTAVCPLHPKAGTLELSPTAVTDSTKSDTKTTGISDDTSDSESTADNYRYNVVEGGITIWDYTGNATHLTVPAIIDEQKVLYINDRAFENCDSLEEITFSEGILTIGNDIFEGCNNLTTVYLPSSITTMDSRSFDLCNTLEAIIVSKDNPDFSSEDGVLFDKEKNTLIRCPSGKSGKYIVPDTVTTLGIDSFEYSKLTEVVLPEGIQTIGNSAFWGSSIAHISFPNSLQVISSMAFTNCTQLSSVHISDGITQIGESAFYKCPNIDTYTVSENNPVFSADDGILFNKGKTTLVKYPTKRTGAYTVPDTVTSIANYAFEYCNNLTEITMPATMTNIGDAAFSDCTGLTHVSIPSKVTHIGESAFANCSNLQKIAFNAHTQSIKGYAFANCTSLKTVTLPMNLSSIKNSAFVGCSNLTSVKIHADNANYTSIDGVIYNKALTELVICPCGKSDNLNLPEGITTLSSGYVGILAYELLDGCNKLKSITLPSTYLGFSDSNYRFEECTSLEAIHISEDHEKYCSIDGVVYDKDATKVIFCPQGKQGIYQMPDTVNTIFKYAFYKCKKLTDITISPNVDTIETYSFYECNLNQVVIPEGLTTIETMAFEGSLINKIHLPESITAIGKKAYGYSSGFNIFDPDIKLEIQPVIRCIQDSFAYHDSLEKGLTLEVLRPLTADMISLDSNTNYTGSQVTPAVTVRNGNTQLQQGIDYEITYQNNIEIGTATVTILGKGNYFGKVVKTFEIIPAASVDTIPDNKTENATLKAGEQFTKGNFIYKIIHVTDGKYHAEVIKPKKKTYKTLTIPATVKYKDISFQVTSVGKNALKNNKKLQKVTIGKNISQIGQGAFDGCKKLKTVVIKSKKIKHIGKYAFRSIMKKATIKIPSSKKNTYRKLFKKAKTSSTAKIKW